MNPFHQFQEQRDQMVKDQLQPRGIHDARVLEAMRRVPRHIFLPPQARHLAYRDSALPIAQRQTISQPYVVAAMTQMLRLRGDERVLEIGTGSGYQTAILCELAAHVTTLERFPQLAERAGGILEKLGYDNVEVHIGDGSQGLADMAPFDAIIVTAAAPALPGPLRQQLNPNGGRLVIPVGTRKNQRLEVVTRRGNRWEIEEMFRVRFVPMLGRYGFNTTDQHRGQGKDDNQAASV